MWIANLIGFALFLITIWLIAFYQLSRMSWTIVLPVVLLIITIFLRLSPILLILFWLTTIVSILFVHLKNIRIKYLLVPNLQKFKTKIPAISATEKEAIDAGAIWWEKDLFCGNPDWRKLYNINTTVLTEEEQSFLDTKVDTLCEMVNDWLIINEEKNLPEEVWTFLKTEKFFGLVIPKAYGGLGFSALAHSSIVTKIATRSLSVAVNMMVPNSLGPGELISHYGTEEQKNYYLPRLANGTEIPCFALTSAVAGSDAGAITDSGVICRAEFEGHRQVGIRLNWDKRYITLAPIATLLGLAFKLYDPEGLIGNKRELGITLCLVPTDLPGVEQGTRHYPLYQAFMNGPIRGKDVFIPLDYIIGGVEKAGQGWRMLMECLSIGRSISLPALATACALSAYRFTGSYARIRKQFNVSLSSFEGIEQALAYIAGFTYILEATRTLTSSAVDIVGKPAIPSAISKYHMTELSRKLVTHAMDIHAGHMVQLGPRNLIGNMYIAIPISITVEGANILTRNLIIFGQGSIRCHPYLLKEVALLTSEDVDLDQLDETLMAHVGYTIRHLLTSFFFGLTGGRLISAYVKHKKAKYYERQLSRMSTALALLSDASLLLLGGKLKRKEFISARLGDILSHLYLGSAVLKSFHDQQENAKDFDYVAWCVQYNLSEIQKAIDEVTQNFPYRVIGRLLRWVIFPFGRSYLPPNDTLSKNILVNMLAPSDLRDRLTQHCFLSKNENELSNRLEILFANLAAVEPLLKKVHQAKRSSDAYPIESYEAQLQKALEEKILSAEEVKLLINFERLKKETIAVNEFSFDFSKIIA